MTSQVTTPPELAGGTFANTIRTKANELKQELIKQTLDDIESWRRAVEHEWAIAHPGEWSGPPIPPEEIEGYRNTVRNEYYEWIVPAFERYLQPDPDATNPMISNLRQIESMFGGSQDDAGTFSPASSALGRVNDVRADMNHWEGDLQINFIDNFVTPLQTVSLNQAAVAKGVREVLEMNKIVYIRYRQGILKLVTEAIEAVKTLNNGRDPKSHTWGTLVGISIGTILTIVPGAAPIGVALIVGSTLAQGLTPDPPKTNELSAPTAQEVAFNVSKAMSTMDKDIYDKGEKPVEDAFKAIYSAISGARSSAIGSNVSGPLSVANPAVSTSKPGDVTDGSLRPDR
jgi:hypothetical protein